MSLPKLESSGDQTKRPSFRGRFPEIHSARSTVLKNKKKAKPQHWFLTEEQREKKKKKGTVLIDFQIKRNPWPFILGQPRLKKDKSELPLSRHLHS